MIYNILLVLFFCSFGQHCINNNHYRELGYRDWECNDNGTQIYSQDVIGQRRCCFVSSSTYIHCNEGQFCACENPTVTSSYAACANEQTRGCGCGNQYYCCDLKECTARAVVTGVNPCGPDDCYEYVSVSPHVCTECHNHQHYFANNIDKTCELLTCVDRTDNGSATFPCGPSCYLVPTIVGAEISTCEEDCVGEYLIKDAVTGRCMHTDCGTRIYSNEMDPFPCGPGCYLDGSDDSGSLTCRAICYNNHHFTKDTETGQCVWETNCMLRTSNGSTTYPCGGTECYLENDNCKPACHLAHYNQNEDTGMCESISDCTLRLNTGVALFPCGLGCVPDLNNAGCVGTCPHSEHYELDESTGTCVLIEECTERVPDGSSEPCGEGCFANTAGTGCSSMNCFDPTNGCEACYGSESGCYAKSALCYYSGSDCINSISANSCLSSSVCSACHSKFECLDHSRSSSCQWSSTNYTCTSAETTSCASTSIRSTPATNSFNVYYGTYTSMGTGQSSGYTTIANINGANSSTLKPNVATTSGGVTTTFRVWNEDCTTVVAEWGMVNSGGTDATVGICMHADTYLNTDSVDWANLASKRGIYTPNYSFYIHSGEAFSGTFAGSYSSRTSYCSSSTVTLSTGVDSGIALNWNSQTVSAGTTRVFQMKFTTYIPCSSGTCSSCPSLRSCYAQSNECYYTDQCYNSSVLSSCSGSSCAACQSLTECINPSRNCFWNSNTKTCSSCSSTSCSSCVDSSRCVDLNSDYCVWSESNQCYNTSSYCAGEACNTCNSDSSCLDLNLQCEWNGACFNTSTTCRSTSCVSCSTEGACTTLDSECRWSESYCYNQSSYCSSSSCSSCNSDSSCGSLHNLCSWSGSSCYNISSYCSGTVCTTCNSANSCTDLNSLECIWSMSACRNTSSYCSSSSCTACNSATSCTSLHDLCSWSGSSCYNISSYCSGELCTSCNSYSSCFDQDMLCAWNDACYNASTTCASTFCEDCSTGGACTALDTECLWSSSSSSCYNQSSYCADSSCSSCNSRDSCVSLSWSCIWSPSQSCYDYSSCSYPTVRDVSPMGGSFDVYFNNSRTTYSSNGYYAYANINGVETSMLIPGVLVTTGSVSIMLSSQTMNCSAVEVKWTLVNNGASTATVGVFFKCDSFIGSDSVSFSNLENLHGVRTSDYDFYIQSEEAFSGTRAGSDYYFNCANYTGAGDIYSGDSGVCLNWHDVSLSGGSTKVFTVLFATFEITYGPGICTGTDCSTCNGSGSCIDLSPAECGWSNSCYNKTTNCGRSSCSTCSNVNTCSALNPSYCAWNDVLNSCYNFSSQCAGSACGTCRTSTACTALSTTYCSWSGSSCYNASCASPYVRASSGSSFDVRLNGSTTTYSSGGYTTYVTVGSSSTGVTLTPGVVSTVGNVRTTLQVYNESCTTVGVEWTLVNSGGSAATVGICLHGDSYIGGSLTVDWATLPDKHGLKAIYYPFYIQASEPFDGVWAGYYNSRSGYCSSTTNTITTSVDSGVCLNYHGVVLQPGVTKVFRVTFATYQDSFAPSTCTGLVCETCNGASACMNLGNCAWSGSTCFDTTTACGGQTCATCFSSTTCTDLSTTCSWTGSACYNISSYCSGVSCDTCNSANSCTSLSSNCSYTGSTCYNASSYCTGTTCGSCNSEESCFGLSSTDCAYIDSVCYNLSSCYPNVSLTFQNNGNSFNVLLNGSGTTYAGYGYTTYATISSSGTGTLMPGIAETMGGVTTTLNVVQNNCTTIVAKYTLVNTGASDVTVGVCLHADSYIGTDSVNWVSVADKHGLHTPSYPFYILADESFSGTYAGSYGSRTSYCSSTSQTVYTGVDSGICVNWNGVTVKTGTTRVLQLRFFTYPGNFAPGSCSGSDCSSCSDSTSCIGLSSTYCYWNGDSTCYNISASGSCTGSDCSTCGSYDSCHRLNEGCSWDGESCYNASSACTGTTCSSCNSASSCTNLNGQCAYVNSICHNTSSYCSGSECGSCNSAASCTSLSSTACYWSSSSIECTNTTLSGVCTGSFCSSCNSATSCASLSSTFCSWTGSSCTNTSTCSGNACYTCPSASSCAALDSTYCLWDGAVCYNTSFCSTPYVRSISGSSGSFDVHLNGSTTTYAAYGYTAYATVGSSNTGTLLANVPRTVGGVTTTLIISDTNCSTVTVEWTLVNSGDGGAVVGICLHGDTKIGGNDYVNLGSLSSLSGKHGLYTPNTPFYIQAEEPFSGVYVGSYGARTSYCGSNIVTVHTGVDSGVAVNWNSITVPSGTTRTFHMTFSTLEGSFVSGSCSGSACDSCNDSSSCAGLSGSCSWSGSQCFDTSTLGTCLGSTCESCSNYGSCQTKSSYGCSWSGSICYNSSAFCSSSYCSSCNSEDICTNLSMDCIWSNLQCYNSSSRCTGESCSSCNSASSCTEYDYFQCSWSGQACYNISSYCGGSSCFTCNSHDSCDHLSTLCTWAGSYCLNTSSFCYGNSCSSCNSPSSCADFSEDCSWSSSSCFNSSVLGTCSGSTCSSCSSPGSCYGLDGLCVWGSFACINTSQDRCFLPSSDCSECSSTDCHDKDYFCYWSSLSNECINTSSHATCELSGLCSSCLSEYDCRYRGPSCRWNTVSHTCSYFSCSNADMDCSICHASPDVCHGKDSYCFYFSSGDSSSADCYNSSMNPTCSSVGSYCSDCLSAYDCLHRRSGCHWDQRSYTCSDSCSGGSDCSGCSNSVSGCYFKDTTCYFHNSYCRNGSTDSSCSPSDDCSSCLSVFECQENLGSCTWNYNDYSCSSTPLNCGSDSCSSCSDVDSCYGLHSMCYYLSGQCHNSTASSLLSAQHFITSSSYSAKRFMEKLSSKMSKSNSQTCFEGDPCTSCLSLFDCMERNTGCAWNSLGHTCTTLCEDSHSDCSACNANATECFEKSENCYYSYDSKYCLESRVPTCNPLMDPCSACRSVRDCAAWVSENGLACTWNTTLSSCGEACTNPTSDCTACSSTSVECYSKGLHCAFDSGACRNVSECSSTDCSSCGSAFACANGYECAWNSDIHVCSSSCTNLASDCTACSSSSAECYSKGLHCTFDSEACRNVSECSSTDCSSCGSAFACASGYDCAWESDTHVCSNSCSNSASDCPACSSSSAECYSKGLHCAFDSGACRNVSECSSTDCSSCGSTFACEERANCTWNSDTYMCSSNNNPRERSGFPWWGWLIIALTLVGVAIIIIFIVWRKTMACKSASLVEQEMSETDKQDVQLTIPQQTQDVDFHQVQNTNTQREHADSSTREEPETQSEHADPSAEQEPEMQSEHADPSTKQEPETQNEHTDLKTKHEPVMQSEYANSSTKLEPETMQTFQAEIYSLECKGQNDGPFEVL